MTEWFLSLAPALQALLATLFTWGLTAAGAGLVVFTTKIGRKGFDAMLGAAAGVMIAASYFSLLAPGIALAEDLFSIASSKLPKLPEPKTLVLRIKTL